LGLFYQKTAPKEKDCLGLSPPPPVSSFLLNFLHLFKGEEYKEGVS